MTFSRRSQSRVARKIVIALSNCVQYSEAVLADDEALGYGVALRRLRK